MNITRLTNNPEHVSEIASWYIDEWGTLLSKVTVESLSQKIQGKLEEITDIPVYFTALERNELVGVVEFKFRENAEYQEYEHWLGGLYVKPTHRGSGVSSALISEVKMHARKLGVDKVYLQCESQLVTMYKYFEFQELHAAMHREIPVVIMVWSSM